MSASRRAWLLVVVVAAAAVLGLVVREAAVGAAAVKACDALLAKGDVAGAIDAAAEAARARAPGSPYAEAGYARLAAIANASEDKDDVPTAARAWRAMRSAAAATIVLDRRPPRLAQADEGLARVAARTRTDARAAADPAAVRADVLAALARDDRPPPIAFFVLAAGAIAFFAGAVRLALLPSSASARQIAARAVVPALGLALAAIACVWN